MPTVYYGYQDICLKPNYSEFRTRNADVSVVFGPRRFKLPVVPANMVCVIDGNLAQWMSENDYFYIMHRFNKDKTKNPNHDNGEFVKRANEENWKTISISIGVQEADMHFLGWCDENDFRIDYITIDIAHAHAIRMKEMIEFIKAPSNTYSKSFLIAGNVATPEGVIDLEVWGADAVKVGIAQGDACSTYGQTGFGLPMFTCVQECAKVAKTPIIADGGVRMNGDFTKAIVAGGSMVMAGSIFAACIDSPAENTYSQDYADKFTERVGVWNRTKNFNATLMVGEQIDPPRYDPPITHKKYYGSASEHNKNSKRHVEGRVVQLPCNGMMYAEKLREIAESLQSAVSYAGNGPDCVQWGVINR